MLIEIHMIQNHSPSNVNRDDLGAPKTAMFGQVPRARISSQCIKRSIRNPESDVSAVTKNMKEYLATRTKQFPELVESALKDAMQSAPNDERLDDDAMKKIVNAAIAIGKSKDAKERSESEDEDEETAQLISLLPNEVRGFVETLLKLRTQLPTDYGKFLENPSRKGGKIPGTKTARPKASDEFYKTLRHARMKSAVDTALFGRMTTSPAFEDFEAAMEVAHAISTHEVQNQTDYFTAVDDLAKGTGAGHVGEKQENSATYYKYFSLDWEQLVTNLRPPKPEQRPDESEEVFGKRMIGWEDTKGEARRLGARAVGHFIEAAATTIPSGMKKGHANNNLPDGVLVEIKSRKIPTSYANAFADPIVRSEERGLIPESVARLGHYAGCVVNGYNLESQRLWFSPTGLRLQYRDIWAKEGELAKPQDVAEHVKTLRDLVEKTVEKTGHSWRELYPAAYGEG